ncbi:MAG: hypothetical protein SF029_06920 [bacterium]|nr:hypothetical protein [bacterium]
MKLQLVVLSMVFLLSFSTSAHENDNDSLPLLPPGQHVTIEYGEVAPGAEDTLDDAFFEIVQAGSDTYALSMWWSLMQPINQTVDLEELQGFLEIMRVLNLQPYFVMPTIDTVQLALPPEFVDANDSTQLAAGVHFNSSEVLESLGTLLDELVPLLMEYNTFYLSVGNEVDAWLSAHPDEIEPFLEFVSFARERVQQLAPDLAVGVTMTYGGAMTYPDLLADLIAVSDVIAFTYYPLNADFTVQDPSVVEEDMAALVEMISPMPVVLQEVGYPSGYLRSPNNGSSGEMQAEFVSNFFDALEAHPEIRFASFLHLGEWSDATCDEFAGYYQLELSAFREYLCSLGLREYNGDAKPGYAVFVERLRQLQN